MDWFPFILLLAFIKFSVILANDYPTEPTCKDLLETEICNNMKNEGNCDQLKYKVECAKTCLQCWSDDHWYVHKYLKNQNYLYFSEKKLSWTDAQSFCREKGMKLYQPRTQEHYEKVWRTAVEIFPSITRYVLCRTYRYKKIENWLKYF